MVIWREKKKERDWFECPFSGSVSNESSDRSDSPSFRRRADLTSNFLPTTVRKLKIAKFADIPDLRIAVEETFAKFYKSCQFKSFNANGVCVCEFINCRELIGKRCWKMIPRSMIIWIFRLRGSYKVIGLDVKVLWGRKEKDFVASRVHLLRRSWLLSWLIDDWSVNSSKEIYF